MLERTIFKRDSLMTTSEILVALTRGKLPGLILQTKVFVVTCKLPYLFSFCTGRETRLLGSTRVVISLNVYPVLFSLKSFLKNQDLSETTQNRRWGVGGGTGNQFMQKRNSC